MTSRALLWLALAGSGSAATALADPYAASDAILAAATARPGDPAYGEYLASECLTCHRASPGAAQIPPIVGWPEEQLILSLANFKTGARESQVMKMVASSLGPEEMAALAAYLGQLPD